jgi:hypothetical protein
MAQQQPVEEPPAVAPALAPDVAQRTAMAAERTWLAWWRTALAATAGALAVGRVAPQVLDVASGPYIALGVGYAALAVGLLLTGLSPARARPGGRPQRAYAAALRAGDAVHDRRRRAGAGHDCAGHRAELTAGLEGLILSQWDANIRSCPLSASCFPASSLSSPLLRARRS